MNDRLDDRARLIEALSGLNADADRAVVQRTRRRVYIAAEEEREGRVLQRKHLGISLLVGAVLFLLLTPALWSGVDDALGGEHITDMPGLVATFVFTLFAGVAAVLFLLGWRSREQARHLRR